MQKVVFASLVVNATGTGGLVFCEGGGEGGLLHLSFTLSPYFPADSRKMQQRRLCIGLL
jgi:hypothetical protein